MAKMSGITGKLQGKYGNAVFRVRRGTQVMAQYNPVVENPNTNKQIAARARWKLVAQLAAIYAQIIAIPREGSRTPRNLFTKINYKLTSFVDEVAQIVLPNVQLTKSSRSMGKFLVSRSNGQAITCALQVGETFSRVVWVVVAKNANQKLRVFATAVVDNPTPGEPNTFAANLPFTSEAVVVYGYAMTDRNSAATAAYNDLEAPTAENIAALLVQTASGMDDFIVTKTLGAYMEVGSTDAVSTDDGDASIVPERPTIGGYSPFAQNTQVVISCATNGVTIYYTTDGSNPNPESDVYSAPFTITETTTVKAVAVLNGINSGRTTRTFVKSDSGRTDVVPPVISGTTPFTTSTQVSISSEAGARIYYTTDGSTPTEASTEYSAPFNLTATTTVKAIASLQGDLSAVTTKVFTLTNQGGGDPEGE